MSAHSPSTPIIGTCTSVVAMMYAMGEYMPFFISARALVYSVLRARTVIRFRIDGMVHTQLSKKRRGITYPRGARWREG